MKNKLKFIFVIALSILTCLTIFVSCGDSRVKITESEIQAKLADSDGTLTIEGTPENVTAFTYYLANINASNLVNKNYAHKAIYSLVNNPSKITYGELQACNAFYATMNVTSVFTNNDGEFDSDEYIEEILSIICDGNTKVYSGWKVSATVDVTTNSITISATCK